MLLSGLCLSIIGNIVLAWFVFRKKKPRRDIAEISRALNDLGKRYGCLVELRRVDPSDVFIWQR